MLVHLKSAKLLFYTFGQHNTNHKLSDQNEENICDLTQNEGLPTEINKTELDMVYAVQLQATFSNEWLNAKLLNSMTPKFMKMAQRIIDKETDKNGTCYPSVKKMDQKDRQSTTLAFNVTIELPLSKYTEEDSHQLVIHIADKLKSELQRLEDKVSNLRVKPELVLR